MAQKMPFAKRSGAEHEYTGAVPVTFTANGQPLLDYLISGNTVQNGTPTPDSPIIPQGTGDLETSGAKAGQYKIPISSASTTTPVYLGEVETTRKIKKLVLTGEENGTIYSTATSRKGIEIAGITGIIGGTADIAILAICTHYQPNTRTALYRNTYNGISNTYQNDRIIFYDVSCQTVEAFQQFCAQQYAAGTPVTVWYVLATEETAVVNEPLMKIGDYADTLSHAQAGVSIPTANGSTTLDVETAVKPSEIYIKYKS
jgi:hypothetical protein